MSLSTVIKSIQDIMRQDAGVDGDAQRISQITWMIFLKIFDDKEKEWELDENYQSPIPEDLRWRNWALNNEGITGDELLDFINNKLFPELKNLSITKDNERIEFLVKELFLDAYNYMKSGTLLRQVINKLNEIDFTKSEDRHMFNDIYEKILKDLQSAGNAGEFYTPRAVTQFIVDMVNPQLKHKVLDPACGTGGFLICAIENMRKKVKSIDDRKQLQENLMGVEKKQLPHMMCVTNLMLHDIEIPNVKHGNSLERPLRDYALKDMVDIVITNPPFGGNEEQGIELNFPLEFRTRETADLFMTLIMKRLRDGGKCGIVLPDGFLFGEGIKTNIKRKLLSEFNLHTIVRLPNGVFNPYTGIRTNLLFFEKGKPTKDIWFFEHPLPEGYKTYNKTKPMQIKEFDLEKEWWNDRNNKNFEQFAWKVDVKDLQKNNFNLDISNPNNGHETKLLSSKELLSKLEDSITNTSKVLEKIKKEL